MYPGDWMHTVDLGVLTNLHASIFQDMAEEDGPFSGGSFERRVERMCAAVHRQYDLCGTTKRIANITSGMIGGSGAIFPTLAAKANESRHLLKPMLALCRLANTGTRASLHRIRTYEILDTMYSLLENDSDLFMGPENAVLLWDLANDFVLHYSWLTKCSLRNGRFRYNLVYKLHSFLHQAFLARYLHPRATWCFIFEDFIGRVKRLAVASARGTAVHQLATKVVLQYRVALSVMMNRNR